MTEIKSIVSAKEFQRALDKVLKAAPKKSRLYFLLEAHVSFDGDTCTLTCTDMEQWCQAVIPAQGGQCSFILKDSRKLLSVCKYFSGDMEFSYQEDDPPEAFPSKQELDGSLVLRCGSRELHQRVTAAGLFPELPELKMEHTYTVDPASLSKRFERIKYALADDPSRPCNQCVQFFDNRIGAVDGYITPVENQFARELESAINRNLQFNSYSYDYRWKDSTKDRKGAKIVLSLFEEFSAYYEVADALFTILDFCEAGIPRLEAALAEAEQKKVIPLPIQAIPEQEAA